MSTIAVPIPGAIPIHMPDVIDSLKRLERIGAEESQTVQKILEAAATLSLAVGKLCPLNLYGKPLATCGIITKRSYFVVGAQLGMIDHSGSNRHVSVSEDRDTALNFAKDIAAGLLDQIEEAIEKYHEESRPALHILEAAIANLPSETPRPNQGCVPDAVKAGILGHKS